MTKSAYIIVMTDCNRNSFLTEITDDPHRVEEIHSHDLLKELAHHDHHGWDVRLTAKFGTAFGKKWRLVHLESFNSRENAQVRQQEIRKYTRMQLERLIRKNNPNWNDLKYRLSDHPEARHYHPGEKFTPNVPNRMSFR